MSSANIASELRHQAVAALYLVSGVLFLWRYPIAATLFLGAGIAFWLWRFRDRADAVAMIAAALLGTPSEMVCVHYKVWTYHAPGLVNGVPIWLPLIWASLFCLFRRITGTGLMIADRLHPRPSRVSRTFFISLGGMVLIYYAVVAVNIHRGIAVVYTVVMLIAVVFWHRERDILIFIVGGILGTVGEYLCMRLGFWQYHFPYFAAIGLPISLPMAWGLSAVIIGRIASIGTSPGPKVKA